MKKFIMRIADNKKLLQKIGIGLSVLSALVTLGTDLIDDRVETISIEEQVMEVLKRKGIDA